ncbi:unnamed protein product [Urochloa decumbens]|uniref:SAWADEE domain-containing protein n=1 Tax=Urochloa decumbens TaxID=240449 RepID=A0ABC8ZYT8_9POAL
MGRLPSKGVKAAPSFRFLPSEVQEMEARLQPLRKPSASRFAVEALARKFSASAERIGKVVIQPKQVHTWFCNRRYYSREGKAARAAQPQKKNSSARGVGVGAYRQLAAAGSSAAVHAGSSSGDNRIVESPIKYEAKSNRDGAWYDVDAVVSSRVSESGESEVMVQYSGYGADHAEWVNAFTSLRQRSVPFKATECVLVRCRDLVLCYKESQQSCLYFDAVVHARRVPSHYTSQCDCKFLVRYEHDDSEVFLYTSNIVQTNTVFNDCSNLCALLHVFYGP